MATAAQIRDDAHFALRNRIARTVEEVIEVPPDDLAGLDLEDARAMVEIALELVVERLASEPAGSPAEHVILLHETLRELDANARSERLDALANIHDGLTRLRGLGSLDRLIETATIEVCRSCGFDRAILLSVDERRKMVVASVALDGSPAERDRLRAELVGIHQQLVPALLETEVVRQRSPLRVTDPSDDPRVFGPIAEHRGVMPFVAAPISCEGRVVGILEADRALTGRRLERLDRDTLSTFADGLGYALERAMMLERLRAQGENVRELARATEAAASELCEAQIELARSDDGAELEPARAFILSPPDPARTTSPRSRAAELLSRREIEVIEAMASGASNAEVAARLYIAESTVKSHVKRILRKLEASNRVEAVTRYLRFSSKRDRGSDSGSASTLG